MPTVKRCQIVLARTSGLPEDRVTMSLWAQPITGTPADSLLMAAVRDFLIVDNSSTMTTSLGAAMGSSIATTGHSVNVYHYDMASGERLAFDNAPPESTLTFSLTPTGDSMPGEVAIAASFRNNTGATVGGGTFAAPAARRRGRIYYGPIGRSFSTTTATAGDVRPTANVIAGLGENLTFFRNSLDVGGHEWVIYSRPYEGRGEITRPGRAPLPPIPARPGQAFLVEQVWVDDAFDTQRRRGAGRTTRSFFV